MKENRRIHIVPIGYDYYTRATEPLIKNNAERVYFLRHNEEDRGHEKFFTKIKEELKKKSKSIVIKEERLDIWNLYQCTEKIRILISKEKKSGNQIYINVSTGTKITAIAGMLAAMAWKVTPYYVRLTNPLLKKIEKIPKVAVDDAQEIPVYDMMKPSSEQLKILNHLPNDGSPMRKRKLIEYLESEKIIQQGEESESVFSDNAKHSQLRVLLEPMKDKLGFVKVEHTGSRSEVRITENGLRALQIFGIEEIE